jgi:hypothetical protein
VQSAVQLREVVVGDAALDLLAAPDGQLGRIELGESFGTPEVFVGFAPAREMTRGECLGVIRLCGADRRSAHA